METTNRSSSFSGPWTNEKHLHYLNSMEAAFVRTMLDNKRRLLRLDRYMPDTSDSTLDLNTHTHPTKKQATASSSPSSVGQKTRMDSRADKRLTRRRHSNPPYTSSEDQVVPQSGK